MMIEHHDLLKEVRYEPDTGNFFWLTKRKGRKPGKPCGSRMVNGYVTMGLFGKDYLAHRLAWLYVHGGWPSGVLDHINGIRHDNRMVNLRDVTQVENLLNVHAPRIDNKVGLRGVSIHKGTGKYCARIKIDKKDKYLGLFATAELAKAAYDDAKQASGRF